MIAHAISGSAVIALLYFVSSNSPYVPNYGEISEAIARVSTEDPLFPDREDGAWITATILVSLAWHESNFHQNVVGDNGRSFGLYQIQPPTAKVQSNMLTVPLTATYIAVDLIRQSFKACERRPWPEKLSWYVASNGCPTHPVIVRKSVERMSYAERLFKKFPPPSSAPSNALPQKQK